MIQLAAIPKFSRDFVTALWDLSGLVPRLFSEIADIEIAGEVEIRLPGAKNLKTSDTVAKMGRSSEPVRLEPSWKFCHRNKAFLGFMRILYLYCRTNVLL